MSSSFELPGELRVSELEGTHDIVGPCLIESRWKHRVRHSINDQPAVLYRHPDTRKVFRREWYDKGLHGRANDLPSIIDESSEDTLSIWHEDGHVGRPRGPAVTWTAPNGIVVREEYWRRGDQPKRGVVAIERNRYTGEETMRELVGLPGMDRFQPAP
ncbi:hypothetical protein [Kordiimonas pumila]|uniref:Uncharacterized protein n=1 Tax=Kordiimonas pumila TaxID=2161677 RepID=A0ABV7D3T0_9PROT|nr:hypothetical protein [Kordiimonas pumila]